ncbi:winged helix-turn-helix transcriptional regulator [Amycolatopsis silviterrae]|uniref:Winged helix-turn-helix transcriptional regulator n=1 Tax=Amycolatopsis silviterrae TaxID=1656914 RepID=A0ABW5H5R3_9PSEU
MDATSPGRSPAAAPLDATFRKDCPGRPLFEQATSRWGLLILLALAPGALRFAQLRDRIGGISEKMLTQNLRTLVRDGLLDRTVETETPLRVSYSLTAIGHDLSGRLRGLIDWSEEHGEEISAARTRHDARTPQPTPTGKRATTA